MLLPGNWLLCAETGHPCTELQRHGPIEAGIYQSSVDSITLPVCRLQSKFSARNRRCGVLRA